MVESQQTSEVALDHWDTKSRISGHFNSHLCQHVCGWTKGGTAI